MAGFRLHMGPQHPSTHGVLHVLLHLEGEWVVGAEIEIGYMHRCFEKHAQYLTFQQIIPYVDRLDYVAPILCEHAYVLGVEQVVGWADQIPKRIEYLRVLAAELNRIASHLLAIGTYAIDLGATTGFLWAFRDREYILELLEAWTGARLLYNYIWVGGVAFDLPLGFTDKLKDFLRYFERSLREIEILLLENRIFQDRTVGVGVIPLELALAHAASGPVLRACGLAWDLRRVRPYSVYPELEFEVPFGQRGDCWDRTYIRLREIQESKKIIEQCIEQLEKAYPSRPDFDPRGLSTKKPRPKEGQTLYAAVEGARGEIGFTLEVEKSKDIPVRVKARSPSLAHLSLLPSLAAEGMWLADFVALLGSLDIVMCEVDR
ncbi:MAG: NADH-quinone oxidoreductase subunit D [Bacteroidia bacterium]|nr:NADH-quinone oxidoreductase subunit D [Bacteroidia bacterium]MDW8014613.1 NADH-quinone oxidoreductase subunit D [Bacteroidia bacterium]